MPIHRYLTHEQVHTAVAFLFQTIDEFNDFSTNDERDLGKIAWIRENDSFYVLKNINPIEWASLSNFTNHDHNELYYTKNEADERFALINHTHDNQFALIDHLHDDRYYTKIDANNKFAQLNHIHNEFVKLEDYEDIDILNKLKNVDGEGSELDADLIRGLPADFSHLLTENGYQKLPSGLIIQWGIAYSSTDKLESFPFHITFPTQCFGVFVNWLKTNQRYVLNVATYNDSNFTIDRYNLLSNGYFNWLAIGC